MSKKKGLKTRRFKIAHPNDPQRYVDQCGFVICWYQEMFKRVAGDDKKAAPEARDALQTLLVCGVDELWALALDNHNRASRWAGRLLANVGFNFKERGKKKKTEAIEDRLYRTNETYRQAKTTLGKLFRNDVWFPTDPLYRALHHELWYCSFYRGELVWPKAQQYLPKLPAALPNEYLPIMKLPKLSERTWRQWAKELWVLVKKKNPQLLVEIQRHRRYQRVESRWSKYRKEFDQHLRTLATAETRGISGG